jgi:hypothetical protein
MINDQFQNENKSFENESLENKIKRLRDLEHKVSILTAEIIKMGGDHRRPIIIHDSSKLGNSPRPKMFHFSNLNNLFE